MANIPEFNPAGFESGKNRYFRVTDGVEAPLDLNADHDHWFKEVYNSPDSRVTFRAIREFLDWEGEDLVAFAVEYNAACQRGYEAHDRTTYGV